MKEIYVSNCEKAFVNKAILNDRRLDGRSTLESRKVQINFGNSWGCCIVSLGQTKVIANVSCDIQQPRTSRPNEGMLHINVELSSIAAQHFESNKQQEETAIINRQLEKCLKDSRCLDLEALCIVAEKKVWNLRVDITIVNHDGNLLDCASIAALSALMHFHRPDVTSTGEEIIIHPFTEKDPLPLTLYHHPICISFITFENGKTVVDPTYIEERVGSAVLTLSLNSYREICSLYFDYISYTSTVADVVGTVSNFAADHAAKLIKQIKDAVKEDVDAKYNKQIPKSNTIQHCITSDKLTSMISERINIKLSTWKHKHEDINEDDMEIDDENSKIVNIGEGTAELLTTKADEYGKGGRNTWYSSDEDSLAGHEFDENDVEFVEEKSKKKVLDNIELSDSEEEATTVLSKNDLL